MTKIRVMGKHYELSVTAVCQNCCNPEYRFRPTGRQLLLLSDGQVVLLSIFAHDLPLLAITVPIIVFAFALLSILRSDRLTGAGKVIWIVVCFPLVGPIVWFIAGKS